MASHSRTIRCHSRCRTRRPTVAASSAAATGRDASNDLSWARCIAVFKMLMVIPRSSRFAAAQAPRGGPPPRAATMFGKGQRSASRAPRSVASVASADGAPCCVRWNAMIAAFVLGPTRPSTPPVSKPLTPRIRCTTRTSAIRLCPKAPIASALSAASSPASASPVGSALRDRHDGGPRARSGLPSTCPGSYPRNASNDWTTQRAGADAEDAGAEEETASRSSGTGTGGSRSRNAACRSG